MSFNNRTRVPKWHFIVFTVLTLAICVFTILGWIEFGKSEEPHPIKFERAVVSIIFLCLGLPGLLSTQLFLFVIEWNDKAIRSRHLLFGMTKTIQWSSLVRYERMTRMRTGFRYHLFGEDGTRVVVDDWLHLYKNEKLKDVFFEKITPLLDQKVKAALSSGSFEFRSRGRKKSHIESDGILQDNFINRFENLETIEVERHDQQYLKGCVGFEKYTLRFSTGRSIQLMTPINDLDVFLEIVKRKAPQAEWIDVNKTLRAIDEGETEMSREQRLLAITRMKKQNWARVLASVTLLVYPAMIVHKFWKHWDKVVANATGPMLQKLIIALVMMAALQIWLWVSIVKTRKKLKELTSRSSRSIQ